MLVPHSPCHDPVAMATPISLDSTTSHSLSQGEVIPEEKFLIHPPLTVQFLVKKMRGLPDNLYMPVFFACRSFALEYEEYEVEGVSSGVLILFVADRSLTSSPVAADVESGSTFDTLGRRTPSSLPSIGFLDENGNRILNDYVLLEREELYAMCRLCGQRESSVVGGIK